MTVVNILMLSTFIFLMPQHHWGLDLRGGSSSSDGEVSTTRPLEHHDDQSESRKGRSEGAGSRGSWGSGVSSLTVPLPVPTDSRQDQSSNQEEGPRHRASDEEGPRETFRGRESRRSGGGPQGGGGEVEVTHVTHQLLDVWLNLRIRRNDQCVTVVNILMLSTFIFLMPQHHWGLDLRGGSSSSDGEVSTTRPLEHHDDQSESRKGRSEGAGSRGSWGSGVSSLTVPLPVPTDSRQDQSSNQEEGPSHRASDGEGPREPFRGIKSRRSGGRPQGGGGGGGGEVRWR